MEGVIDKPVDMASKIIDKWKLITAIISISITLVGTLITVGIYLGRVNENSAGIKELKESDKAIVKEIKDQFKDMKDDLNLRLTDYHNELSDLKFELGKGFKKVTKQREITPAVSSALPDGYYRDPITKEIKQIPAELVGKGN